MLEGVLVEDLRVAGVVGRIYVHAVHLFPVSGLEQVERLEVLSVDEETVLLLLQRPGVGEGFQQLVREVPVEVPRVQHQERVGAQELHRERLRKTDAAVAEIPSDFVEGEQANPFFPLRRIRRDLGPERLRNPVEGDTPMALQHELLLEPEALLEVFQLGQEHDDPVADLPHGAQLRQRPFQTRRAAPVEVVRPQDFGIQVEVQLLPQETAQVVVDEVVETVLGGVAVEVLRQHRSVAVRVGGGRRGQRGRPFFGNRAEDPRDRLLVEPRLLMDPVPGPLLLLRRGQ